MPDVQSGTTNIKAWQQFSENALITQVSFTNPFSATPSITASLDCDSRSQIPTAGIRIMNPNPTGFTAYVQRADGEGLTVAKAKSSNWRVSYIASVQKS